MNTNIKFPDNFGKILTKVTSNEIPSGVSIINAPLVWQYTKGENVVVAVIDTGVDLNHPDLKDNIIEAVSLIDNNPQDAHGHGTHVAGTIAGIENGNGVVGVAPKAKILSIKVFPDSGEGSNLPIAEAVEFATKWTGKNGEKVRVINMSLTTGNTPSLYNAIKKAVDSGITVCCASGNEGDNNPNTDEKYYPAMYQEVVEVGAWDITGSMAYFSNSNNQVDIVASGVDVKSCFINGQYATWSGTSMATPHITGACALLISGLEKSSRRKLSEPEIFYALSKRTKDLGLDKRLQGNGLLDLSLHIDEFVNGVSIMPKQPEVYLLIAGDTQIYVSDSQFDAEEKLRNMVNTGQFSSGYVQRLSDRAIVFTYKSSDRKTVGSTLLTGKAQVSAEQMELELHRIIPDAPYYANLYLQEGEMEGIRGDFAFAQAMRDTLFFLFKGEQYGAGQFNFGRLGKNPLETSFPDARIGVRSHIQHLKAGANKEPLRNPCVDPFFNEVVRGSRPTLESLSGTWHVGYDKSIYQSLQQAITAKDAYHNWIIDRYEKMLNTFVPNGYVAPNPYPKPVEGDESKVNTLIIYFGDADLHYAKLLSDFVGGFIVSETEFKKSPIKFSTCFKVGGTYLPEGNVINLSGINRQETAKKVLAYITK